MAMIAITTSNSINVKPCRPDKSLACAIRPRRFLIAPESLLGRFFKAASSFRIAICIPNQCRRFTPAAKFVKPDLSTGTGSLLLDR
jgi:hypothetical protein